MQNENVVVWTNTPHVTLGHDTLTFQLPSHYCSRHYFLARGKQELVCRCWIGSIHNLIFFAKAWKVLNALANIFLNTNDRNGISYKFRKRRYEKFLSFLTRTENQENRSVLDVGGTERFWDMMGTLDTLEVTLLNISRIHVTKPKFQSVIGDARDMSQFADGAFDVVFSNSVIEHVGDISDQKQMATEVQRVGKRFFLQTPNKRFPIEPHFLFPFFQYMPFTIKIWLVRHFSLGNYRKARDFEEAIRYVNEIRLLTYKELRTLFPDAKIVREKFLSLTKSFMIYR